jgi:hypothetical protein
LGANRSESTIVSAKVTELEQKKAQLLEQLTDLYREKVCGDLQCAARPDRAACKSETSVAMLRLREESQHAAERMDKKDKECVFRSCASRGV